MVKQNNTIFVYIHNLNSTNFIYFHKTKTGLPYGSPALSVHAKREGNRNFADRDSKYGFKNKKSGINPLRNANKQR